MPDGQSVRAAFGAMRFADGAPTFCFVRTTVGTDPNFPTPKSGVGGDVIPVLIHVADQPVQSGVAFDDHIVAHAL